MSVHMYNMDLQNKSFRNLLIFSFLFTSILFLFMWFPSSLTNPFRDRSCPSSSSNLVPIDELELALNKATMGKKKTVIITVVNKAYVEQSVEGDTTMFDLFLESFWLGEATRPLLNHLLIVAIDQIAYQRCSFKRLHCYMLITDGTVDFSGEKVYMSRDFINMMWSRTLFLLDVLKRGYSFIFTDTDVMWLRNPFQRLTQNESLDLQISVDIHKTSLVNTGFYYVRSNSRSVSLFTTWYNFKDTSTGLKEQDVLLRLLRSGTLDELGIRIQFLNTLYFSGFCQDSRDLAVVTTVHANCCRHIAAKIHDLTFVLRDWKRFKAAMGSNNALNFSWSPHARCRRSWNDTLYNPLP